MGVKSSLKRERKQDKNSEKKRVCVCVGGGERE